MRSWWPGISSRNPDRKGRNGKVLTSISGGAVPYDPASSKISHTRI
jgi:hypothetical protein